MVVPKVEAATVKEMAVKVKVVMCGGDGGGDGGSNEGGVMAGWRGRR